MEAEEMKRMTASDAQAVADVVRTYMKPELIEIETGAGDESLDLPDKVKVILHPKEIAVTSVKKLMDEYRLAPERREGVARLVELESLIAHVNRFKDDDSALFAEPGGVSPGNIQSPSITAVLDYHRRNVRNDKDGVDVGDPRFGRHRGVYTFPVSDPWMAWIAQNGKPMAQADFATWLEDRIVDVADPDNAFLSAKRFAEQLGIVGFATPSRLLTLSRGLSIHIDERATSKIDPSTGETTVFYEVEHADSTGSPLAIPRAFIVQIPVFRSGALYQLPVRLKYRASGGRITWSYEIHDVSKAFDDAFHEACEDASRKTDLPLFYGTPEKA